MDTNDQQGTGRRFFISLLFGLWELSIIHKVFERRDICLTLLAISLITILLFSAMYPKTSSGIVSKSSCHCVIFRLTNLQDYFINKAQLAIMDMFLSKNQNLVLGLIMNQIGDDPAIIDKVSEGSKRGLFELAINGWNFTDYSRLSEEVQKDSLIKANRKMENLFDTSSRIFIPPYGSYDNSTLEAMRGANFSVLSSTSGIDQNDYFDVYQKNGHGLNRNQTIYHLPAISSFNSYNTTGLTEVPIQKIKNDINQSMNEFGYAIVNLDPQFFINKTKEGDQVELNYQMINNLSSLVDFLIMNNIDIETFSEIIEISTNVPIIYNRAINLSSAPSTNLTSNKVVILAFDDGGKGQYTIAKPILDNYGFRATFFIVCNYVGKDIAGKRMDWQDIEALHNAGYDIESHTMNHENLSKVSQRQLEFEIGQSKQCLLDHGINSTIFAYPQNEGSHNKTVVDTVSKYYELARTGEEPLMYLHCDGWKGISSQTDCNPYFDNGTLTFVNRYSIPGWTHNSHSSTVYNSSQMFQKFLEVINSQSNYNYDGVKTIPIITYHNITYQDIREYGLDTLSINKDLFEAEMKYLRDNNFNVLTMADLAYNEYTNYIYIKNFQFVNS